MQLQRCIISPNRFRVWDQLTCWFRAYGNRKAWTIPLSSSTSIRTLYTDHSATLASSFGYHPLDVLDDASLDSFRENCFVPERPAILPRGHFRGIPAFERWFQAANSSSFFSSGDNISRLKVEYLHKHGADAFVPLELTESPPYPANGNNAEDDEHSFRRFHAPLSVFLQWIQQTTHESPMRLYLAQCQLLDLPQALRDDFPTPSLVSQAGKGDVYDTNIWVGLPPTYTPLHRDPNPNLFVQLAGQKRVRLLTPDDGLALFAFVRRKLRRAGNREAAMFRGEEMMQGKERELLDQVVWNDSDEANGPDSAPQEKKNGYEAQLGPGDGLFIPKGWWHSIKGVGKEVTASVCLLCCM